jgi:hypothetical protein
MGARPRTFPGSRTLTQQEWQHMRQLRTLATAALVCGAMGLSGPAPAKDITVLGNWSLTIGPGDLVGGAGTDLNSTYQSNPAQVYVTISNCQNRNDQWHVNVRRTDTVWDSQLQLWVQRTGDGVGSGRSIAGGTTYQQVGLTDGYFFYGQGDRSSIPVQLELTGVSVSLAPGTYSTTITYTLVDGW